MKKTLKKLLVCILIVLVINNFFFTNICFAGMDDFLEKMLGAVVGLLTFPVRLIAIACGKAINTLTAAIAFMEGSIDENGNVNSGDHRSTLTPFDIVFNEVALVDVNFFNLLNDNSVLSSIRNSIASWYYVMRMLAASILLCMLIYVGIRMAITTIASDKAAYKKMLVDWVCSLVLIFLVQYIMLFTFAVNEALIKAIRATAGEMDKFTDAIIQIEGIANNLVDVNSIGATIVYCMIVAQTIALLFSYFKRMLKVAFLVIISPLITLTYSIDKMGDGKAQALNTWLKEFVYNVLLQSFHCIIYSVFVSMALEILNKGGENKEALAGCVIAVLCIKFTKDAEEILGKIFDFKGSTGDSSIGAGMIAGAALMNSAGKIGKGTKSAINGVRNLNLGGQMRNLKVAAIATKASLFGVKDENGERKKMDSNEALDYANTNVTEKEARKLENKNSKGKYAVSTKDKAYQKAVSEKADELMKNTGMTKKAALAEARKQVAQKTKDKRKQQKRNDFNKKHRVIGGARSTLGNLNEARKTLMKTETAKFLKDMGKATIATGIGTFAGSAMYGLKGDAFSAIMAGAGVKKGTEEFLKASTTNLKDRSEDILKGMGISGAQAAENEMKTVSALAPILGDNTELQRQLDELLKFVESAFDNKDDAKDAKTSIKNTVAKSIKENPLISPDELTKKVKDNLQDSVTAEQYGKITGTNTNGDTINASMENAFKSGIGDVSKMQRRKELYDTMQNAAQLGLTEETFTRIVSKGYHGTSSDSGDYQFQTDDNSRTSKEVATDIIKNGENITNENIEQLASERSEEDLGQIRQELQDAREELEKQINEMDAGPDRDELEKESLRLFESMKAMDGHMKKEIEPVLAEYKANYDSAMSRLQAELEVAKQQATQKAQREATTEAQRKFDNEVAKIRQEAEAYKSRLEKNFGKEYNAGVYSSEFVDTMKGLKTSGEFEN